jgi:hypothetical protein
MTDKYIVFYNGKPVTALNPRLVAKQGITDEGLEKLKKLHQDRLFIEDEMYKTESPIFLKTLNRTWTTIQFDLQEAWGFEKDAKFHRFWEVPKCTCPKLDAIDNYPYRQIINMSCPVHGEHFENTN